MPARREHARAEARPVGRDAGEVVGAGGKKSKKPRAFFRGKKKPLVLNATNCKAITAIVGSPDVERWAGQWITLFPTTCQATTGETVECIRVKPQAPMKVGPAAASAPDGKTGPE